MKRNETASNTSVVLKLVAVVVAVALSGCAVTGSSWSDGVSSEVFNDVHYGP